MNSSANQVGHRASKRILAVASGGGHWDELMLLKDAWRGSKVSYATTMAGLGERAGVGQVHLIPDCNRDAKWEILRCAIALIPLFVRVRPQVVVTTGALPSLLNGIDRRAQFLSCNALDSTSRHGFRALLARFPT